MPIIKSAKKRVKVAAQATTRNARVKRAMREAIKTFTKALAQGKADEVNKAQRAAESAIDMAAKKKLIHKNKAARQKAKLAAMAKSAGVKAKSSKPKAKNKPAAKKTPTKKTAAKKTAKA